MRYHFTDTEVKKLLDSMVILVDTREQDNGHLLSYFDKKKITHEKKALPTADYSCKIPKNDEHKDR